MTDTTTQNPVVTYLESIIKARQIFDSVRPPLHADWMYRTYEEAVLDLGKPFNGSHLPLSIRRRTPKQCYANTYKLVDRYPHLTYVEGYAVSANGPIAVQHAWAIDKNGVVVDATWEDPKHASYYGIVIPIDTVRALALRHGVYGVIGNDYLLGVPLLKYGTFFPPKNDDGG